METPSHTGPKDVFTHLLSIILLYVGVITFGNLIFQYINFYFPDILEYQYAPYLRGSIRWPLAILVIIFPFFLWLNSYLQKDLKRFPQKRELKTRRWLIHLTLFITTIVILGDLVTLVYRFLGGEFTIRFILKVLAVFIIALGVFVYYLWILRREVPPSKHPGMRWFVWLSSGVIGVAIIAGFFLVGSPQAERLRLLDERRTNDLSSLQYEIITYWQLKDELPKTLEELKDDVRGFYPPTDSKSNLPYTYRIIEDLSFELCATFETSNKESPNSSANYPKAIGLDPYVTQWNHDVGETCFIRTIDPERYPKRSIF